jgi:hypothetical protein
MKKILSLCAILAIALIVMNGYGWAYELLRHIR